MNRNTRAKKKLSKFSTEGPVISQNKERNMEMVIVGGKTVHRPINANLPFKPYKRGKFFDNNDEQQ